MHEFLICLTQLKICQVKADEASMKKLDDMLSPLGDRLRAMDTHTHMIKLWVGRKSALVN